MASYKDILNTFGGNSSYADRYQAASLKGDTAGMSSIAQEYRASQGMGGNTASTPTTYQTPTPTPAQQAQQDYVDQGYYKSGAYNDIGGINVGDWNYGIDTPDRQSEIVSNLNAAYSEDPSRFADWDTFAKNFNYAYTGRSEKERETMRNWYSNKVGQVPEGTPTYGNIYGQYNPNDVNNTDFFFSQLLQGTPLTGTGAAIIAAQNRYKNYQYLSSMTPDQISSAVQSGAINAVGQEMQDLKNYSPTLYAQVQAQIQGQTQVKDINALGEGIYNGLTSTETNKNYTNYNMTSDYTANASIIKQYNESLYNQILKLGGDTAAYVGIVASMLQNPVIQTAKNEVEDLEGEVNKIQEQMYTIGDTVRATLGSEAPEDLVSAYISNQTKQLQNQLRTAQNSLLVAQGKLNNQLSEVEAIIDVLGMGGAGGTSSSSSDYQFVSGNKYQPAGYFNKKTGEFIPLSGSTGTSSGTGTGGGTGGTGGTTTAKPDTNNYQDDSATRLNQIRTNLNSLAKSNPEYFKDRATFNEYFKYSQRSAKQKAILDEFWANNKGMLTTGTRIGGTTAQTQTSSNGLVNDIKSALISGPVNFTSTSMKNSYKSKYGVTSWDEDTTNDYLQEIGKISSISELKTMLSHLSKDANKKALLSSLKSKVISELQAIKDKTERTNKFKDYAKRLGVDANTLASRWGIK